MQRRIIYCLRVTNVVTVNWVGDEDDVENVKAVIAVRVTGMSGGDAQKLKSLEELEAEAGR